MKDNTKTKQPDVITGPPGILVGITLACLLVAMVFASMTDAIVLDDPIAQNTPNHPFFPQQR